MELFGPSSLDTSSPASNPGRLVNLWADKVEAGGKTRRLLRSAAGMTSFARTGSLFVRDAFTLDTAVFAVVNDRLYRCTSGAAALCGAVEPGPTASISRNGTVATVVSGGRYYNWNGSTLSTPSAGAFSNFGSVGFLAQRTLLSELNGNRWCWSDIAAPQTLDGLNYAVAESRDDKIIRLMVSSGIVMLFGELSTEMWSVTGQGGANAFALLPGAVMDTGLKAFGLAVQTDGAVFLVGDDNIAYMAAGNSWAPVSTAPVNTALKDGQPERCVYWEDRGHKFCAIVFADRPAWVFDLATREWWERAEGVSYARWRATASARLGDLWIIGANDGNLYSLGGVTDDGGVLCREATGYPMIRNNDWFTLAELELFTGHGFQVMDRPASITLETSRDGIVFGRAMTRSLGMDGDFQKRVLFRGLGRHRQIVPRVTMTDEVDIPLYADARVRVA